MANDPNGTPQKNRTPKSRKPRPKPGLPDKSLARTGSTTTEKEAPPVPRVHGADNRVVVDAGVLLAAADLIAAQGQRERLAFERGTLRGFGQGWDQRGVYDAERGAS